MADYKLSDQAQSDLFDLYRYGVDRYGVRKADEFYNTLFDCFAMIAEAPLIWVKVDYIKDGYRRYIYRKGRGRTMIYYRIVQGGVEIMTVVQRQDMAGR